MALASNVPDGVGARRLSAVRTSGVWSALPFVGRAGTWVALGLVTVLWLRMTQAAWRLRAIVVDYRAMHGGYDVHGLWPEHMRAFHDQMIAVGADYFYPFAWATFIAVGLAWMALATAATRSRRHRRRYLILGSGAGVLIAQMVIFGPALVTYVNVTE